VDRILDTTCFRWGKAFDETDLLRAVREDLTTRQPLIAEVEALILENQVENDVGELFPNRLDKIWLTQEDSEVRDTHAAQHGMRLSMEDIFPNGCHHPGDPDAPGHEIINCRCVMILAPKI
jgi:hypothetical protein